MYELPLLNTSPKIIPLDGQKDNPLINIVAC